MNPPFLCIDARQLPAYITKLKDSLYRSWAGPETHNQTQASYKQTISFRIGLEKYSKNNSNDTSAFLEKRRTQKVHRTIPQKISWGEALRFWVSPFPKRRCRAPNGWSEEASATRAILLQILMRL